MSGEWNIDAVDLDAYLARVGQERRPPTAAALTALTRAHVEAIPFENVDVVLGRHQGIGLEAVAAKLVGRHRGGYCYEHAGLFAAVAERLGYQVQRTVARVQPDRGGPYTHMTLIVTAEGTPYLVDVGFGTGMLVPMALEDGVVVDQGGWPHRLVRRGSWWVFQKQDRNSWEDLHEFLTDVHSRPVDYEVYHHYISTHPQSVFFGRLILMRLEDGRLRRLIGRELTESRPGEQDKTTTIAPENLEKTLLDLDIVLDGEELAELKKRY
ncbi:arylamine N-acetyltransferase [Amycolatopsis rhabdoformis]|uniref:Arylamine N-acetyltransferase n=1 Tax=Amycolatopsis rhabdoformis TaxID=1448059 RepID=A0ABZ1I378_9PSEU|nr:arylamine N-acetyltransferase [Amycolatopsis rhabdoformis]WSE28859.1 arylamine N-acetyltransferase [Amycolatopsis rhabdoformis]